MGVVICAALLLTAWVVFVFSKYNPDRRLRSGSIESRKAACSCPTRSQRRIAGTDNHRRESLISIRREER